MPLLVIGNSCFLKKPLGCPPTHLPGWDSSHIYDPAAEVFLGMPGINCPSPCFPHKTLLSSRIKASLGLRKVTKGEFT